MRERFGRIVGYVVGLSVNWWLGRPYRRFRFRYWDGRRVRSTNAVDVIVEMWQLRPDLGKLLDRYEQLSSPWALEVSSLLDLLRTVFDLPELTDASGRTPGLSEVEVMGLFGRFLTYCLQQSLNLRPDLKEGGRAATSA